MAEIKHWGTGGLRNFMCGVQHDSRSYGTVWAGKCDINCLECLKMALFERNIVYPENRDVVMKKIKEVEFKQSFRNFINE